MGKIRVFLGGTCNDSRWRGDLISLLLPDYVEYFDPVVDDWNEEAQRRELEERATCDFCLYTITPLMTGVYSIAEVVDDSNKRPEKTLFCYLTKDSTLSYVSEDHPSIKTFTNGQIWSLEAVGRLVMENGGKTFRKLRDVADFLNSQAGG